MYESDRGIEELLHRRDGDESVDLTWLADRMRTFVDQHPGFEEAIGRFAVFLARDDE